MADETPSPELLARLEANQKKIDEDTKKAALRSTLGVPARIPIIATIPDGKIKALDDRLTTESRMLAAQSNEEDKKAIASETDLEVAWTELLRAKAQKFPWSKLADWALKGGIGALLGAIGVKLLGW